MRSPVFRTMFYGSLPEKCVGAIDVPDVHPDAFANMLSCSCLYADRVDLNHENVFPTLYCADRYDVPLLTDLCSRFILSDLNAGSCLMYLDNAVKWHANDLVDPCLRVVDAYCENVLRFKGLNQIDRGTLEMILRRSTLRASENAVYTAVEKWATAACARNDEEPTAHPGRSAAPRTISVNERYRAARWTRHEWAATGGGIVGHLPVQTCHYAAGNSVFIAAKKRFAAAFSG
ncbi:BTB/POZ domain-containing protein 6-like [Paramacrobiotus metropolitanus]|uniref:BTB/POZ domain-containing protein 6-like n=1 Tax=Paramacrobiotus metropolitanus TaxID=2943436 RepID=UPI00244609A1|nr:BTB/POZ domain-containing protein 6-like [Paramacrobiotus metropolitanus]